MRRLAERMTLIVIPRPPKRAFERLERTAGKLARYALRGEDDGNIIFLPNCHPIPKCRARVLWNPARRRYIPFPELLKLKVNEFWRRIGSAHSRTGHASCAAHTTHNYNGTAWRLM